MVSKLYSYQVTRNSGETMLMDAYQGKVLLIVNTASACGFTPQYEGLQKLYDAYKEQGLVVMAFPCNQFGKQEKGSDDDIRQFCDLTFNVDFPLFAKIDVNGSQAHPLFKHLTEHAKGLLGSKAIKWNFTKFLVSKNGDVVKRYAPTTKPEDLKADIEALL
ncbi:glutathione peroxidase [Echinimonas agarilytica]